MVSLTKRLLLGLLVVGVCVVIGQSIYPHGYSEQFVDQAYKTVGTNITVDTVQVQELSETNLVVVGWGGINATSAWAGYMMFDVINPPDNLRTE